MPGVPSSSASPAVIPTATAVPTPLTNGMQSAVRSQPTTPSRPVLQNHHSNNNHSSCEKSLMDDNDSKSLGSSNLTASRHRSQPSAVIRGGIGGQNSNSGSTGIMGGAIGGTAGGGAGLTIPTELTNFYLKNKKIIDGSDVRVVVKDEPKEELQHNNHHDHPQQQQNQFAVDDLNPGDVDARDKQKEKRKGRKKGAKGYDHVIATAGAALLLNSNSNSGFPPAADATAVGKKVKTTRQLVADLKIRAEQNQRNASYQDLSNDQEHNNNGISSSPMSVSNDSQHHLFHHNHHNQHSAGHDQMVFHSAPVTPSGLVYAGLKREASEGVDNLEKAAAARKLEKKRRKLDKEAAAKLKPKKKEKSE